MQQMLLMLLGPLPERRVLPSVLHSHSHQDALKAVAENAHARVAANEFQHWTIIIVILQSQL
jgi:hypothetical protein